MTHLFESGCCSPVTNTVVVRILAICNKEDSNEANSLEVALLDEEVFSDHFIGREKFFFNGYSSIEGEIKGTAEEFSKLDPFLKFRCVCGGMTKVKTVPLNRYGVGDQTKCYLPVTNEALVEINATCKKTGSTKLDSLEAELYDFDILGHRYLNKQKLLFDNKEEVSMAIRSIIEDLPTFDPFLDYKCICNDIVNEDVIELIDYCTANSVERHYFVKIDCDFKNDNL
uniref:Sporulation protein n=1 Tax=Parastrongyloides trichosuri TaxID=131310 RepID=A0A0N5A757_PARTI